MDNADGLMQGPSSRLVDTESILDAFPHPTFAINGQYTIIRLNRAALSYASAELFADVIGKSCSETVHSRKTICPFCPALDPGDPPAQGRHMERIIQNKNEKGEERTIRVSFFFLYKDRIQLVETLEDITLQREKQEESLRRENLAALGTMISGIAHELNNPLTGIGLTLQNLEANLRMMEMDEIQRRLSIIRKDLSRASRIVSDILLFSRPGPLKLNHTDVLQVLNRAKLTILRLYPVMSRKVEWELSCDHPDVILPIHPEKIERLFFNLFRNSIQAMDYGEGRIRIDVRRTRKWVHILIEDNAGGIPEEMIKKIFNPFYSNQKQGQGSGLGLSICHSIVKEHRGRIRARSDTRSGHTVFHISLPLELSGESGL